MDTDSYDQTVGQVMAEERMASYPLPSAPRTGARSSPGGATSTMRPLPKWRPRPSG